jgi:hypothetical protein
LRTGAAEATAGTAADSARVAPADRNCRRFRAMDLAVRWSAVIAALSTDLCARSGAAVKAFWVHRWCVVATVMAPQRDML